MVKTTIDAHCGNSPKQSFVKDFIIAFAEGNIDFIADVVSDDIVWEIVGEKYIQGKTEFIRELTKLRKSETSELVISNIVTHGKQAAVNGVMILQTNAKRSFCDVYSFTSAKGNAIQTMTSYVIKEN